jgi:hypothetical protein
VVNYLPAKSSLLLFFLESPQLAIIADKTAHKKSEDVFIMHLLVGRNDID